MRILHHGEVALYRCFLGRGRHAVLVCARHSDGVVWCRRRGRLVVGLFVNTPAAGRVWKARPPFLPLAPQWRCVHQPPLAVTAVILTHGFTSSQQVPRFGRELKCEPACPRAPVDPIWTLGRPRLFIFTTTATTSPHLQSVDACGQTLRAPPSVICDASALLALTPPRFAHRTTARRHPASPVPRTAGPLEPSSPSRTRVLASVVRTTVPAHSPVPAVAAQECGDNERPNHPGYGAAMAAQALFGAPLCPDDTRHYAHHTAGPGERLRIAWRRCLGR
jgi:hypothetical protein